MNLDHALAEILNPILPFCRYTIYTQIDFPSLDSDVGADQVRRRDLYWQGPEQGVRSSEGAMPCNAVWNWLNPTEV